MTEPPEGYDGSAVVLVAAEDPTDGAAEYQVEVSLRGVFQPIDGRFHWYGRIAASPDLASLRSGTTVRLRTPGGEARGRLSDVDPWGRLRVAGTGQPPF